MNYNGFDVYKTYLAIKLHFTTTAYDYHKYNGKVNASLEQFTRRNDRYFFYKLSNRYAKDSIVDYFVSNFASNNKKWIGNTLMKFQINLVSGVTYIFIIRFDFI